MFTRAFVWVLLSVFGWPLTSQAQTHYFRNYSVGDGLPFVRVSAVCQDSRGYLWTGGYGGISRFDGEQFISITQKEGLADDLVTCILGDAAGNLWVGTAGGLSLVVPDPVSGLPEEIRNFSLKNRRVNALACDEAGNVYVATGSGLFAVRGDTIMELPVAHGEEVLSVAVDGKGNIWAGVRSGLAAYNGKREKRFSSADGMPGDDVHALFVDRSGYLWVGTDRGAGRISVTNTDRLFEGADEDQKLFVTYEEDPHAPEGKVNAFAEDSKGRLWIAGDAGLSRYDDVKGFRLYRIGRKTSANPAHSLLRDYEGNLWIGTENGLFRYDPSEGHPDAVSPRVHIMGFRIFSKDTMLAQDIALPYGQNHLTFRYACLSFANTGKVLYRYRLTGFDGDWSPPAGERSVTYSNLRPGSYTFEVMAANKDGVWSAQPATFPFRITAPFWLTWWFRLSSVSAVVAAALAAVRYRLRRKRGAGPISSTSV